MLKNYLKIAWRNLKRHKTFSFINIAGLAAGIACAVLILLWVQDEMSFDRFHKHAPEIYRIVADWEKNAWGGFEGTPGPLAPAAREQLPEIIATARFASQSRKVFRVGERSFYEDRGIIVDTAFFKIFSFPFIEGNADAAFTSPSDIILTESLARKYFGEKNPLGQPLEIDGRPATVTGVLADIPPNSHIRFDYAQSFDYIDELTGYGTSWGAFNFLTYIRIPNNADRVDIGKKLTALALDNHCPQVQNGVTFRLQPLTRVHLDARNYQRPGIVLGDSRYVTLFSLVAFFVLLIACVNFMNLATARSALRAREVGMRKTVGAQRLQLVRQFFCESLLLAFLAGTAALVMVWLAMPAFNQLSGKKISLSLINPGHSLILAAIIVTTGLLAGSYPALYLSTFKPAAVLRGETRSGKKDSAFRRGLVVSQFALSILLIIATTVVYRQLQFMKNQKLSFNPDNVVFFPIKGDIGRKFEAVKHELLQKPGILRVTAQNYLFMETTWRTTGIDWEGRDPEARRDIIVHYIDIDFFKTLELELRDGRFFSPGFPTDEKEAFIINEEAVKQMGITPAVGKPFTFFRDRNNRLQGKIIGVLKNGHFRSLHHKIEPHIFLLNQDWTEATDYGVVIVKIDGTQTTTALGHIQRIWEKFNPSTPFEYHFLDQRYGQLYQKEQRTGIIFNAFTALAVGISALGLLGLASFMAQRRTREIGIRKVLGASESGLVVLLSKQFIRWVLLANVISWPVAYYAADKWLENYAYRIHLSPWIFLFSGVLALGTAMLTVSFQTVKAARSNPAKAMRYE